MARRKKPEGETPEQAKHRQLLEHIANFSTRSEKTSWHRKFDNLVKIVAKLEAYEERIFAIMAERQPILDELQELRRVMVHECVHPFEHLAITDEHIECKFCNRRFVVTNHMSNACDKT